MSGNKATILLDDTNYMDWVVYTESVAVTSEFVDILDGTSIRPLGEDRAPAVKKWLKSNRSARARLIQLVRPSQYVHFNSPLARECWENLARIHAARGFTSRQPRLRKWVASEIQPEEKEETFIGRIRQEARVLTEMGADITDQWVMLVLTMGVLSRHPTLVDALDNVDEEKLTVEYVVQRILNAAALRSTTDSDLERPEHRAMRASAAPHRSRGSALPDASSAVPAPSGVRCHRCKGFGHFVSVCPSPPSVISQAAAAVQGEPSDHEESFSFLNPPTGLATAAHSFSWRDTEFEF